MARGGGYNDRYAGEAIGGVIGTILGWAAKKLYYGIKYLIVEAFKKPPPEQNITLKMLYEHTHIVAGTGFGKTQLLQGMILRDLDPIKRGLQTTIVIDSQGDMINRVLQLKQLADPELSKRLIVIDPHDIALPPCLNLFDFGLERTEQYTPVQRERLLNSAIQLYEYIFS